MSTTSSQPALDVLVRTGDARGIRRWPATLERVVAGVRSALDTLAREDAPERLGVPPVIARETIERAGYATAFPHLLGSIEAFDPQAEGSVASDAVLLPAACYHVYPLLEGRTLDAGCSFDVEGWCYRHEATTELGRLRAFRMREIVRVDRPAAVAAWRDGWAERAARWLVELGLTPRTEVATDPFFGPGARLLAASQREQELKLELHVALAEGREQAVVSCNRHGDHFSASFAFGAPDGKRLDTGCVAFGLERLALALLHAHGADPAAWPRELRAGLGLAP